MRVLRLSLLSLAVVQGFLASHKNNPTRRCNRQLDLHAPSDDDYSTSSEPLVSRRQAGFLAVGGALATSGLLLSTPEPAYAEDSYKPALRPTAYRVDSTEPPTLIPLKSARKELQVLKDLGQGSGTDKDQILVDTVNLNNILQKAVYGSIEAVAGLAGGREQIERTGPGYASFVCLGVPAATTPTDIDLATSLLTNILQPRKKDTALGLAFCPLSGQPALLAYSKSGDESALVASLVDTGVAEATVQLFLPLLQFARTKSLELLAMAPEPQDVQTARSQGLQNVPPERRSAYVLDPNGFIALSQSPKYRVYADKSLLKDYEAASANDKAGDFFAERILVHETAASVAASYAVQRPDSLVTIVALTPDLRFLQGINGRIARICAFLNAQNITNKVTENAVTTILLNPTAKETLSKSRYLRLEIGTGPATLAYQAKVADYLWFSASPKVNLIPRLMNG
jgi:hypothetical protein